MKKDSLEFYIDSQNMRGTQYSEEAENTETAGAPIISLFANFNFYELLALWGTATAFLCAYFFCYLNNVSYGSLLHAKILYTVFVGINLLAAAISLHAWSRIPSRSIAKDAMLFLTISTCSAAAGNTIDFMFWIFNIAPFKQSIFTNLFFIFAILFALPGVHLLGRVCRVEFSKQPLVYYFAFMGIYMAIPLLMNPNLIGNLTDIGNLKEFIFGLLYAVGIGYLASISLFLWKNAQGKLFSAARLISLGLSLLSFGCSIYAGLFPGLPAVEIPSSPVHLILALGYIAGALGIHKTELTINRIFNLQESKLPPSLHLVEIFGPSHGMAVYRRMEESIKNTIEELLKSKAESEMKQQTIVELENEVRLRKETERALIVEKERAEEANRTKSQFLAMMSHELKTPLTAVKGYSQLLSDISWPVKTLDPTKVSEISRQIAVNADHLHHMIDGILRFSHLESGQFTYNREEFDLKEIVNHTESMIRQQPQYSAENYLLIIPDHNLRVFTDKLALQHVISNLLTNAFKFCKDGKITLEIKRLERSLFVAVEDEGIGIAPEHAEKIFEAFYQVSHGNRRKYGGTGLGLSVVKKITEELGGKIELFSEPGKGSRFEITLPDVVIED